MYETDSKDLWRIFRSHHYLSGDFNKAAKFYLVYWDDVLVAMASMLTMPCGTIKYAYRQHRLVVLPDYQGLGIGTKVNDFFARYYVERGYKYFIRTTHVRLKNHLSKLPDWKGTSTNGKLRSVKGIEENVQKQEMGLAHTGITGDRRVAASFEYLGDDYVNKPEKIIRVDEVKDLEKFKQYILELKEKYYIKVATGKPSEDSDIEKAMREIGVRTEQLWIKKKDTLSLNSKFAKVEQYIES